MFVKRADWENLERDNRNLYRYIQELQQKEKMFEDAFYNGLDGLLEKCYKPAPKEPMILFQDAYRDVDTTTNQEVLPQTVVPEELKTILKVIDTSFSDKLMELIRQKKLNEVEVYKKADLDRRHFSKIRSNSDYRPAKDTVILLCMSMELTYDETVDLLKRAGFAFSSSSKTDLIAEFFIRKKLYNIAFYKEVLYKYGVLKD